LIFNSNPIINHCKVSNNFACWNGGGWETGLTGTNEYGDAIITVEKDITLPVYFFNCSNELQPYDWLPWVQQANTVAVWFRVYMATVDGVNKGYNPAFPNLQIGIRRNDFNGHGPLNWDNREVLLNRETDDNNLPGFHIYSGIVYYPDSLAGQIQYYKFFIEPNGWESCGDHSFSIPPEDNTLHWIYFGNSTPVIVNAAEEQVDNPYKFILYNNYPNPFNPRTKIKFTIPSNVKREMSYVTLKVYDVLGNEIKTLVSEYKQAGSYEVEYEAVDLSSGVYFYQLRAVDRSAGSGLSFVETKKMILIK
jgi:hypothetical protein